MFRVRDFNKNVNVNSDKGSDSDDSFNTDNSED